MTNATVKKPCGHPLLDLNRPLSKERRCWTCVRADTKALLDDPHIRRYITVIKQKPRSGGILSRSTLSALCLSIHNFMRHLGLSSPSELIALKANKTANDFELENSLDICFRDLPFQTPMLPHQQTIRPPKFYLK